MLTIHNGSGTAMVATAADNIKVGNAKDLAGSYMYLTNATGDYRNGWAIYAFILGC